MLFLLTVSLCGYEVFIRIDSLLSLQPVPPEDRRGHYLIGWIWVPELKSVLLFFALAYFLSMIIYLNPLWCQLHMDSLSALIFSWVSTTWCIMQIPGTNLKENQPIKETNSTCILPCSMDFFPQCIFKIHVNREKDTLGRKVCEQDNWVKEKGKENLTQSFATPCLPWFLFLGISNLLSL